MVSLDIAIVIIKKVADIGFEGLRTYTIATEDEKEINRYVTMDEEKYEEVIDRMANACWKGMDYFKMWLQESCVKKMGLLRSTPHSIDFEIDGLYYVEFAGSESHYFIWIIKGDKIWYAGTYGGVCDITVKEFNKLDYKRRFINAMKGSIEDYGYVFQTVPFVETVNFEWIKLTKSDRYV